MGVGDMSAPQKIELIGNELALVWPDGKETYLPLEYLRRACPCATCGGEPDVLGRIAKPTVSFEANSFVLCKLEVVGGYALQPVWADGHATGLYSWEFLSRLGRLHQGSERT